MLHVRKRGGAFVPLALRTQRGVLGFIPLLDEVPGKHEMASAQSFVTNYQGARCVFVHLGKTDRMLAGNMRVVPLGCLV